MQDSLYNKPNSLGSDRRIPTSEGYSNSLKAKSIANHYYKLFFVPNQKDAARLGIIASKKCMHKAVERNANKRLVREVFRSHSIKSKQFDLVVLVRQTNPLTFTTQRVELASLFSKFETRCV